MNGNQTLSPVDVQTSDRRTDVRTTKVFRPVLIETEEFAGFCLVRDLSQSGLRGKVFAQLAEGLPISVQFTDEILVPATIVWFKDEHIGVKFDQSINVDAILGKLGNKFVGKKITRAPRLQIQCKGELAFNGQFRTIEVQDISQRGLGARTDFYIAPDQEVQVRLVGLEPRKAVVRWTQHGKVGLHFIRPIAFDELAKWVIHLQSA